MLACDGRVTTACACAKEKRTPAAASASMFGVRAGPPSQPSASPRNVSMVTSSTFRSGVWRTSSGLIPHAAALHPRRTATATAASNDLKRT